MQKTLVLIRHAKSSWANPLQSDFERPLNERGEQDAPMMAERLRKRNIIPDLIISSTAKRAAQTAKKIAKTIGYDSDRILWKDRLYQCIASVFEEVIQEIGSSINTVFIVAHNPGITDFVNELSPAFRTDSMPTCAVAGIRVDLNDWGDFHASEKIPFLFDYPKNQHDQQ